MKFAKVAMASLIVFATGCGKPDITDSPLKTDDNSGTDTSGDASDFYGTWVGSCEKDTDASTSSKTSVVIAEGTITATTLSYSDANCTTETLHVTANATIVFGESVVTPAGAKEVNVQPTYFVFTPKTDEMVTALNETNTCGGGFVKNTEKSLNAVTCASDEFYKDAFSESFDVFKIDGNKLYEGECGDSGSATDCSAATKRPTTLETTYYTKS